MVEIAPPPLLNDETVDPDLGERPDTVTGELACPLLPPPFEDSEPLPLEELPLRDPPPERPPPPPPLAPPPLRG